MQNRAAVCATLSPMKKSASRGCLPAWWSRWCAVAAPKRAPTHEDIWLMKRVGAPQVSPDGRWIVVSVIEPAYDDNAQLSDLWLIDTAARNSSRRLTSTRRPESGVVVEPGQPPHRVQRAARQRRCAADLLARSGRGRRSAAADQPLRRRTRPGVFARRPATRLRVHHVSAARDDGDQQGSASRRIARASRMRASSTASRSAAGIAGSTNARRASSCSRSTKTASPSGNAARPAGRHPARWPARVSPAARPTRAKKSKSNSRLTTRPWCSPRPPIATKPRMHSRIRSCSSST